MLLFIHFLKCDQKCIVEKGKIEKLCDDLGFMCYVETSAKENIGIDDAIKLLISQVSGCSVVIRHQGHK